MQASKLFRNLTPFLNGAAAWLKPSDFADLANHASMDPSPTSWSSMGFVPIVEGDEPEYVLDVQGAGRLLLLQFNERNLPGKVRDEEVRKRAAKLAEQQGRQIGKKEWTEVRSEVEIDLLPKAFIRRTLVPILLIKDTTVALASGQILLFTGSAKKADDAIMFLCRALDPKSDYKRFKPVLLGNAIKANAGVTLTGLANGEILDDEFEATDNAVLNGPEKQVVRIKDDDINGSDVQALLDNFTVSRLGLSHGSESDEFTTFTLSDKVIYSGIKVAGVNNERVKDPKAAADLFISTTWLIAQAVRQIVAASCVLLDAQMDKPLNTDDDDPL